ncbi:MAG: sulfurtransferase [Chromatiaceae bacterium]|nr:sulfurtransferase [Chromatiaceae bacterium]
MLRRLLISVLLSILAFAPAAQAARDFLVDADWLAAEQANNPKLIVLEVRYHPHRYFTVGHIPGAIQVQRFKDLGDNDGRSIMLFPSQEDFQATLRRWGVNDDSTLVIYDDSRSALAARLYYLLGLYGFDMARVKVLNGGALEWSGFNNLTQEPTPNPAPGFVTLKGANPALFVPWQEVYDDVVSRRDPGVVLVDARPADMYSGKTIRHSVQGGHIPGALNVVSLDGTDPLTQKWRDETELAGLYQAVSRDKTVYLYCHDGFRMSLGWLQLHAMGFQDIRLLDGGWGVWDRAFTLPVVTGDQPYDEEFAL